MTANVHIKKPLHENSIGFNNKPSQRENFQSHNNDTKGCLSPQETCQTESKKVTSLSADTVLSEAHPMPSRNSAGCGINSRRRGEHKRCPDRTTLLAKEVSLESLLAALTYQMIGGVL